VAEGGRGSRLPCRLSDDAGAGHILVIYHDYFHMGTECIIAMLCTIKKYLLCGIDIQHSYFLVESSFDQIGAHQF
jgi:hypothetical protein